MGYRWSSALAYVEGVRDGLTDENPHLGGLTAECRAD
jgi:hypothetical protein